MKIVFMNPSAQLGGAERSLLDIIASIRAARPEWPIHLIASGEGPLGAKATQLGATVHVLPFPKAIALLGDAGVHGPAGDRVLRRTLFLQIGLAAPAVLRYVHSMRRILREIQPDLIHTNGFKMHIVGSWARPEGVPVVWHIHDYVSVRPVMSRLMRLHWGRNAAVVTNSRSVAEDVAKVCGDADNVHPVYNAVDLDQFSPVGPVADLDDLAGFDEPEPGTVRIGLVATLGRWKGHATFLKALAMLDPEVRYRAYIVGGALYQTGGSQYSLNDLRDIAVRHGIAGRLGFTGFVESPAEAMRGLDIVVHASTEPEPFGLVIAEAMACGRALVASQAGGSAELFQSGVDALAYAPGDANALARCLERVATDPDLRARLEANGRATAERDFDRTRLATDLIPIYERAVGKDQ